ncbi:MAG: S9 family peptidase [Planctomycetota bacterium]
MVITMMAGGLAGGAGFGQSSGRPATRPAGGGTAPGPIALIPRDVLFGNPDRAQVRISPDGRQLAFIAPLDGVMNVWVAPADDPNTAKAITRDKGRGIHQYFWAYTNQHILYVQDRDGDENWRIYSVGLAGGEPQELTPGKDVQARIQEVSHKFPELILIALNARNPELHDIHRVNILTGETQLVEQNDEGFAGYLTDDDFNVRLAVRVTPDGGSEILKRDGEAWATFITVAQADSLTTNPLGFDKRGATLFMLDSRGRDTAALTAVDLRTEAARVLAESPRADVSEVLIHPTEKNIQAAGFTYLRREWKVLDPAIEPDFKYLATVAHGEFDVVSRALDDRHWIVAYVMDDGPVQFYAYDRPARHATFLFTNRKALEGLPLAPMHPVIIRARDGLNLVSYLTLPLGSAVAANPLATQPATGPAAPPVPRPAQPLPLVLLVHGGPWARDAWGYDPYHQWLANRGYAVLSVNFRGSTGFGKQFVNVADREWAGRMHDDLVDAVQWATRERIADPQKVAIMGGSYGGYATLAGLTFTPEVFACGVDIVGPSSLVTLIESIPPYWKPILDMFATRVGDPRTEAGRKALLERSPLTRVARISKPLLIGQGANDPRVKQAESDQIVKAMQAKNIPVTYVLFPDEGHGFVRPENNLAFNAIAEAFLAEHLGGRFEPVGDDFRGSTVQVPVGAAQVPGLAAALPRPAHE